MTVWRWSQTAASNNTADSTINLREGQAPSTLNDSVRALMAAIAKWRDDLAGTINTAGTSTAVTITSNQGLTALTDGFTVRARITTTFGADPTLAVDGLTAKAITRIDGAAIPAGQIVAGSIQTFTYDAGDDEWRVEGDRQEFASGTSMLFGGATAPAGWTKQVAVNDVALRLVSGTPGQGGTTPFSEIFAARTIAQGNLPAVTLSVTGVTSSNGSHNHDINNLSSAASGLGGGGSPTYQVAGSKSTSTDGAHTHTVSGDTEALGSGTAMDFDVQYVDVIAAVKD